VVPSANAPTVCAGDPAATALDLAQYGAALLVIEDRAGESAKSRAVVELLADDGVFRNSELPMVRTITPRFSGQRQAWPDQQMVAIAASLACPMRFKFWTQICLPTQFTLDRTTGGAFGYLDWGISHGNRTSAA
jgi:hypothetical protein